MNASKPTKRMLEIGIAVLVFVAAWGTARKLSSSEPQGAPPPVQPVDLLNQVVPNSGVTDARGKPVRLLDFVKGSPAVLFLAGVETCLDCTRFPSEMRILTREFPGMRQVFMGVGRDTAFFAGYARREHVAAHTLLDPEGKVQQELGLSPTLPLVLVLDDDGRILMADSRGGGRFSAYPISRMLLNLRGTLSASDSVVDGARRPR
ncbi:MAG: redoxin domain-containing protein [Gemmatimonadetes bacterium]|nr:redoxin domain-containing protein [Gemmatimonadota bacterium]